MIRHTHTDSNQATTAHRPGRAQLVSGTLLALVALLSAPGSGYAKEQLKVKSSLSNTGVQPGARASVKATLRPKKSKLLIKAQGLDPALSYQFTVGGVSEAALAVDDKGRAKIKFKTGKTPALDFDARGLVVAINDGATDVLASVFSGTGESLDAKVDERSSLAPTSLAPGGSGKTRFRSDKGRQRFSVEAEDIPDGSYDVFVGGVNRGSIEVALGEGEIEFDSRGDAGKPLLDFDPREQTIDVTQNGAVFLSGDTAADINGVNLCEASEINSAPASTGADPDGSASARLRVRDDCDRDFSVEIEDVPVGDYSLLVDGVLRGTISVIDDGISVKGQIEFDSDPDNPGELLLDFDPNQALIEVQQGSTVFFSGVFDGVGGPPSGCTFQENDLPLLNSGVDADASGSARLRVREDCDEDFRVEIEDLALGDYDLFVDSVLRGSISVIDTGVKIEGRIEFDTNPDSPGELLLDFDPRGRLIEVSQGGVVYLSRPFPAL